MITKEPFDQERVAFKWYLRRLFYNFFISTKCCLQGFKLEKCFVKRFDGQRQVRQAVCSECALLQNTLQYFQCLQSVSKQIEFT